MFIFKIQYHIGNALYLSGVRSSLDTLASSNPHWGYQMMPGPACSLDDVHLKIVDFTVCKTLEDIRAHAAPDTTRTLVLLKVNQKDLISALIKEHRYSILCVDEVHFQMRDVIEIVMKKKRYLSQYASRHQSIILPTEVVILTRTEHKVLSYLWEGRSGVDISKVLFRSEKTISTHKRSIMRKLNVTSDLELRKCIQHYENKVVAQED